MKSSLFQTILLSVFGFSALIGLFVFATYTNKNGSNAVGTVVIWGTLPQESIEKALAGSIQVESSLKNVVYIQKDSATLSADIATAIATGVSPDLILASQEELHMLTKFISPISYSTLSAKTFSSTFLREGEIFTAPAGAGYYGIPFLVDPLVLFSNRSILSSNGIAAPPATWESLIGLVPTITVLTPARQITRGLIALGAYDNVHAARGILSTLFLQQNIPMSSYSANGALSADFGEDSAGNSPASAVLGFYTQFADPSKVSYTWNTSLRDSEQMFLSGDLALHLGYASRARFLATANPNLDFAVTPVPQSATAKKKSAYGLVYAFMISRGTGNAAGAYQAAALLTNPGEQAAAATATGLAPATVSELAKVSSTDPVAAVAYTEALYSAGWLSPAPVDIDRIFSSMIGNVISGHSTLDTALTDAKRSLNAMLQQ